MDPRKNTVKTRILNGIGLNVIERPRELQKAAGTSEHNVVHELYAMKTQGLVEFRRKKNLHSRGVNLTDIRLTREGIKLWKEIP